MLEFVGFKGFQKADAILPSLKELALHDISHQAYTPANENVTEFDTIAYKCKEGSKPLGAADATADGEVVNGEFHLRCEPRIT